MNQAETVEPLATPGQARQGQEEGAPAGPARAGDPAGLELADVVDAGAIQALMEDFYRLTGIGVAVLDRHGRVLVATGWQEICTHFHRTHPEAAHHCLESDTLLSNDVPGGTFKLYRCKNNMWDMATPIVVGGQHLGNIFLGQFFFEDEAPDEALFRQQARRYGFDESAYLAALERVPRWSREKVETAMAFYARFAALVAYLSHSNLQLARALAERDTLLHDLGQSEAKYRILVETAGEAIVVTQDGLLKFVNARAAEMLGYQQQELAARPFAG